MLSSLYMLKLLSVNTKWDLFTDRILALIQKEQPDILCLQEVLSRDIQAYENVMGSKANVYLMGGVAGEYTRSGSYDGMNIAIISKLPVKDVTSEYYAQYHDGTPVTDDESGLPYNRVLASVLVVSGGDEYRIATTHFTWTPHAFPDERQERDLAVFLKLLDGLGDFVLCGDLNAPRGMATFDTLAARYTDHIPAHYTSSLDPELHRLKGSKQLMIDGLFTTPEYECSDVELIFGVSDHAAIRAFLTKR